MKKLLLYGFLIILFGCDSSKNCKNALCTMLFARINIQLSDTSNVKLIGIMTETHLVSNGEFIRSQTSSNGFLDSSYTLVDDSDLKQLGFSKTQKVNFSILKDGKLLKTIPFTIETDCCHVTKVDGPDLISLN